MRKVSWRGSSKIHKGGWRSGLKPDAEYLVLLKEAENSIMTVRPNEIKRLAEETKRCRDATFTAKKLAGSPATAADFEEVDILMKDALVLRVEIELFEALGEREGRAKIKEKVVQIAKQLRDCGLKDSKVLAHGLWQETFDLLTSASGKAAAAAS